MKEDDVAGFTSEIREIFPCRMKVEVRSDEYADRIAGALRADGFFVTGIQLDTPTQAQFAPAKILEAMSKTDNPSTGIGDEFPDAAARSAWVKVVRSDSICVAMLAEQS